MAFYLCKICGNPMDPIYSDGVCDDCYFGQSSFFPLKNDKKSRASSRSASSGKKKKSKIQKAAALIMALMIALSCLTFSAFADEVQYDNDHHTYMGYDTISYDIGDSISFAHLLSYGEAARANGYNYVAYYLLDFDADGNPHFYSKSNQGWFCYTDFSSSLLRLFLFNTSFLDNTSTEYIDYSAYFSYDVSGQTYRWKKYSDLTYSDGSVSAFTYTDGVSGFDGFLGHSKYLVAVPCTDGSDIQSNFAALLNGTYDDNFTAAEPKPEAGFITAKPPEPGKITVIDWVGAGTQYPLFDFWINDNKCYDTYVLRISSNDSYTQYLYDKGQSDNTIDWLGYNSSFGTQQINWLIQALNYDKLQWDVVRNITDSTFTFAETDTSNRRGYTICLSDYFSVVEYLLYRAEIIDQSTGKLVAVTYFSTNRNYNKGSSGFGSKVSHYSDDNNSGWEMDLSDGKFGNADETEDKGDMTVDNKNDIVITYDPSGLSLDSFTDYLSGLSGQLGGFFTACWGIVPGEMMVILIGGLTIMVTCALILLLARR